uniref:Uncharacterized protein n=2 Tax=Canis lupus familiaris TaxID=9615 RepID=A0A8C0SM30_CANLF
MQKEEGRTLKIKRCQNNGRLGRRCGAPAEAGASREGWWPTRTPGLWGRGSGLSLLRLAGSPRGPLELEGKPVPSTKSQKLQLHLVPPSCLLLGRKFEGKEDSVPKLEQLNSLGCIINMNLVLTKQNLLHMELLLETFQWGIACLWPRACPFHYYLSEAVHETDLDDGWSMICLEKNETLQDQVCRFPGSIFARLCLFKLCTFFSSCCMWASSRIILCPSPTWPTRLHRLTAYSWDFFLVQCIEQLLIAHDNDVNDANRGQAGSQPAQLSVLQSASQPTRPVHFQQPHYLHETHHTSLQYRHPVAEQPRCQQMGSTTHSSSDTLQTHVQTGVGMSLAIPEVKPCPNVSYNQSSQKNEYYPCITPCFEK